MFKREREQFMVFKERFAKLINVRTEMEKAIEDVFWNYNTSIRENRFIVGGVIEYVLGAAMRACSIPLKHRGTSRTDIDLVFEGSEVGYSIKAILKGTGTRLVNVMGERPTRDRWCSATLFLIPTLGIVYVDPKLEWWVFHSEECIRITSDALTVSVKCIKKFLEECPDWVVPCKLPQEADRAERTHSSRTASSDVAAQVLMHYEKLFSELADLKSR